MYFLKRILIILFLVTLIYSIKEDSASVEKISAIEKTDTVATTNLDTGKFNQQYYLLDNTLSIYDSIALLGGWDSIILIKDTIKLSKVNSLVTQLRKRLGIEGYKSNHIVTKTDSFDLELKKCLESFQKNRGLQITGELNAKTVNALNIGVEMRIMQIKQNMERWKKFPKNIEEEYLFVNVPDFTMDLIKNDAVILSMKTIVGKPYRRTPVITSSITSIVFNPNWYIPEKIAKKDILPHVLKDVSYLEDQNIRIFQTDNQGKRKEISPDSINWSDITINTFSYNLMQERGSDNALGYIKFMIPNNHNIYMHDTPTKKLFEKTERTFSSGCIRLSNAFGLAEYLLRDKWDRKKIRNTITEGETVFVQLSEPMKVYIEYFTAWVDKSGQIQFRKDIYKRDI